VGVTYERYPTHGKGVEDPEAAMRQLNDEVRDGVVGVVRLEGVLSYPRYMRRKTVV
jgi:hypothetical protein